MDLVTALHDVGAPARAYKRAPVPKEVFLVGMDPKGRGEILIQSGTATLEIHPDKKARQVAVNVTEPPRTFSRTISMNASALMRPGQDASEIDLKVVEREMLRRATTLFPVQFATNANPKFKVSNIKYRPRVMGGYRDNGKRRRTYRGPQVERWTATMTATLGRTTNTSLLMGLDEHSAFVCILPRKVSSVADAHAALRPKGVPEGSPRQGEFFFVPIKNKALIKTLDREAKATETRTRDSLDWNAAGWYGRGSRVPKGRRQPLERDSSHEGLVTMVHGGVTYVKDVVFDRRPMHHAPLELGDTWHRVVRNTEVIERPRTNEVRQVRRRFSYD